MYCSIVSISLFYKLLTKVHMFMFRLIYNTVLINLLLFSQHYFVSHTTVPSANMTFHSNTISTLAHLLPLSLAHLLQQKTPFKLAIIYNKNIADAHPSFLLEEAILFVLKSICNNESTFDEIQIALRHRLCRHRRTSTFCCWCHNWLHDVLWDPIIMMWIREKW